MRPVYLVRYGIPAGIALAGLLVVVIGSGSLATAAGIVLVGVAALVFGVDVLARLSIASQEDREREQRAREMFTRRRQWPDQRPSAGPGSRERP